MSKPTFPVGINVYVIEDGKLLLGKRKGSSGEGMWGLPGGHLEDRESMKETAARELKEETGLEAESFTFINLVNNPRQESHYVNTGFLAGGVRGTVELKEPDKCSEWKYFPLDALPENIFYGHTLLIKNFKLSVPFGDSLDR